MKEPKAVKIIRYILTFLGFSLVHTSCYGTPYSEMVVAGIVTDEENTPIENILVLQGQNEICRTDAVGSFQDLVFYDTTADELTVRFVDTDGPANGGDFQTVELTQDLRESSRRSRDVISGNMHVVMKKL